jgi:pimeloyl-ACP methyl ester carboxylesterase
MGETDNPKRDEDYSMKATVQHLHGFLTALKVQSAHLVGSSRGALPVARQAVDHPEMTRTLIMFNSNTVAPDDPSTPIDWYYRNPRAKPASPKIAEAEKKMLVLGSQWVERNRAAAELSNIDGPSVWWLRDLKFETIDLIKAGKLKAPTLIIWGFEDQSAPLVLAFNLINLVAAAPDETVRMIADFVKYLPRS